MKKNVFLAIFSATMLVFSSCEEEKDSPALSSLGTYATGILVMNEGSTSVGSSISFIDTTTKTVVNDLFSMSNNGKPLGLFAQSINYLGGNFYLLATTSNKIEIVSDINFKIVNTLTDFKMPRYVEVTNPTKAYITEWGANGFGDSLAVLDLTTNKIIKHITVGMGPDKILKYSGALYIANKGGWGLDSTVSVVYTGSDQVIATIKVGAAPEGIVLDQLNRVWVLCSGGEWQADYSMKHTGSLYLIDPSNYNKIIKKFKFASKYSQPSSIVMNKAKDAFFYLYDGKVFKMNIRDTARLPITPVINRNFYHINLDPNTDDIYGTTASFSAAGYLVRYKAKTYAKIDSFQVGVGCGEIFVQ